METTYAYVDKSSAPLTHYTYRCCSAMETHAMKLMVCLSCTDVNVRDLEPCSNQVSRVLGIFFFLTQCASAIDEQLIKEYSGAVWGSQLIQ